MGWYKTGTVSVTNGSTAVIGTGTAFIANARVGDEFRGPDGRTYEITNIASDTALAISPAYGAVSAYALAPMQGYIKDSADQLRAATKTIGSTATDMTDQVSIAQAAAASAATDKDSASASAASANQSKNAAASSATTASSAKDQSGQSASAALASQNASKTSETNAANSATRAEAAAGSVTNKASAGANNDITSIGGLTTALSVAQGGTGGNSSSSARTSLGVVPVSSVSDVTAGRLLTPGWMGFGGSLRAIPSIDFNSLPAYSFPFIGQSTSNGPESGDFYISHEYFDANNANVTATSISSGKQYYRTNVGAWGIWKPVGGTWGAIAGTLSSQADLQAALDAKQSVSSAALIPTASTFVNITAIGTSYTLPSGGTWAWWTAPFTNSAGSLQGSSTSGLSAGGTVIRAAVAGVNYVGFAWRVS